MEAHMRSVHSLEIKLSLFSWCFEDEIDINNKVNWIYWQPLVCTCIDGICKDGLQGQEDDHKDEERLGAGVHGEEQRRTEEEAPSSHIFCAPATTRSPHTHGALDILLYYPDIFSFSATDAKLSGSPKSDTWRQSII